MPRNPQIHHHKDAQALALRIQGKTYSQIAKELGWTGTTSAFEAVKRGLKRDTGEHILEARSLAEARLEELLTVVWPKAKQGDLESINMALKLIDRHCKLLGLDAPQRTQVEVEGKLTHLSISALDLEIARLIADERASRGLPALDELRRMDETTPTLAPPSP